MMKKDNLLLFVVLVIVILSTAKYCSSGEKYIFETDASDELLHLEQGDKISQQVFIDKKSSWRKDSYAIQLSLDTVQMDSAQFKNGVFKLEISQDGEVKQQYIEKLQEIQIEDNWYVLQGFDYTKLEKGTAVISIEIAEGSADFCLVENRYNIPDCLLNGVDTGKTMVQKYAVHYVNAEYILRLVLYFVLIVLLLGMGYILVACSETKFICNVIQIGLICSFLIFIYIYDSSFYLEPTWAEAVTNFMHHAGTESIWKNFTLPEAGYLPVFQRFIAVLFIKILHIPAYYALFLMQVSAYFISGYILSFFVKKPFGNYICLKGRFIISLMLMIQMLELATLTFINFYPYGIYLILLFFVSDTDAWSRTEYVCMTVLSCLCCMAKGQYVVVMPFVLVSFLLFHKNLNKRDKRYMFFVALSSTVQCIYSFWSPSAGGTEWIDQTQSVSQRGYFIKLFCELIRDIPNIFLYLFEHNIYFWNGISILLIIAFWAAVIFFIVKIFLAEYKKVPMDQDIKNLGMMFVFLCGQRLFFRLSVYGVSEYDICSDEFWSFSPISPGYRYEVFGTFAAVICFLIFMKRSKAVIAVFVICIMLSNTRLQIKGLGTDAYSVNRGYVSGMNSEVCLLKDLEKKESIAIPIRPDPWFYSKNASMYYIGTDILDLKVNRISEASVENGNVSLHDFANMDQKSGICQIFIKKLNFVDSCAYRVRLTDRGGHMITEVEQDNTEYQKIASFTFADPVYDVDGIQILNERGEEVWIENGIYLVSSQQESLLKNKMYAVNTHSDFASLLDSVWEQPFTALEEKLSVVQLRLGTFNRSNTGTLHIEIVDERGRVISRQEMDVSKLEDNRLNDVLFQDCRLKKGEEYAVRIYSDDFDENSCVAVYTETDVDEPLKYAKCNGIEQEYYLELNIYGDNSDE